MRVKSEKTFFLMQIRNAYSPIRYPYYEITQGYDEATLGINSSWKSVGFGLSARGERTGSPSGRTKDKLSEDERFGKLIDVTGGQARCERMIDTGPADFSSLPRHIYFLQFHLRRCKITISFP